MKYFIDDLIPLILDADDYWWQNHLAALLYYVCKRLYPCPDIRTMGAAQKLADTLEGNEYLQGSLVRGISLQGMRNTPMSRLGEGMKVIRTLLGLERLRTITVGSEINRCLGLIGNPEEVEELGIRGQRGLGWPRTVEWDERLRLGFPRLKKMELRGVDLDVMWPSGGHPACKAERVQIIDSLRGEEVQTVRRGRVQSAPQSAGHVAK